MKIISGALLLLLSASVWAAVSADPGKTGKGIVSASTGILSDGTNIAVGGVATSSSATLRVRKVYTDTAGAQINASSSTNTVTTGGSYNNGHIDAGANHGTIASGVTNSGINYGIRAYSARTAGSADAGTLADSRAGWFYFGHGASGVNATAVTTAAYGIYIQPDYRAGTVTAGYGLYLASPNGTEGTVTSRYGIYQADANDKNHFSGSIGGMVEDLHGYITSVADGTYVIMEKNRVARQVDKIALKCSGTSATAALQIGGSNITTCNGISVTSTVSDTTCDTGATNNLAAGGRLTLVISSNSSCGNLSWSIQTTRDD